MGRDGTEIKLDRRNFIRTMEEIGIQPASGSTQKMVLLFEVSNGAVLDLLRIGNIDVGYITGVKVQG